MKIAFCAIGTESLAISILSAIAKKEGHTVKLAYVPNLFKDGLTRESKWLSGLFNIDKEIVDQIKHYQPDIIAFSVVTHSYQLSLHYAEIFKTICPDTKIVFGGIHVSSVPEIVIANDCIDYIVIGEGEIAFSEIIKSIEKGIFSEPIVNTWYKSKNNTIIKGKQIGFIQDLDSLPHFDKEIWGKIFPLETYYLTVTSRGCPYNCSYCFNHFFRCIPDEKSNYIRRRSIKHVMEELTIAKEKYKISAIDFWDDVFTLDKKWLKEFLEAYKKDVALPFRCYVHAGLFDEDIAKWLHEAGCKWAAFGIQSINEEYRKKYLKRHETNSDIIKTIQLLKEYKITSFADYIIGLPGDTEDHYEEARLFFIENMPDKLELYWMAYHPKTEIIEKGFEHNILNDEKMELINKGYSQSYFIKGTLGTKDFHENYLFIFKLLPMLPVFLRHKLTYGIAKKIPQPIKELIEVCFTLYLCFKLDDLRVKHLIISYYKKRIIWILKLKFFSKKQKR